MADRPILFSAPMIRALLDGSKTQTRRIFKGVEAQGNGMLHLHSAGGGLVNVAEADVPAEALDYVRHQVGDRLWVRENFSGPHEWASVPPSGWGWANMTRPPIWYWADGNPAEGDWTKPRPSIHMPRWASRLTLTVTDVRVQRLQDISDDDAEAEGCPPCEACGGCSWINEGPDGGWQCTAHGCGDPYVESYERLWNSLNAKRGFGWDANPWVVALTFEVVRDNIDALALPPQDSSGGAAE